MPEWHAGRFTTWLREALGKGAPKGIPSDQRDGGQIGLAVQGIFWRDAQFFFLREGKRLTDRTWVVDERTTRASLGLVLGS